MMNVLRIPVVLTLIGLWLTGCASTPLFDASNVDTGLTPKSATADVAASRGKAVIWGGIVIAASNLKSQTEFEILAYPLDSKFRPRTDDRPLGRFIARQDGYLETADYTQGRLLTVSGVFEDTNLGRIGDSEYTYPVVRIDRLHLWPKQSDESGTRFHFGVGVMFHN